MLAKYLKSINGLFVATVVVPTALSVLYFGVFASDIYISEAKFIVRSPQAKQASAFGYLISTAGFANSSSETFAVDEYINSRGAMDDVNRHGRIRNAFGNHSISTFDRFGGIGRGDSDEHLYNYYADMVSANYDTSTGVTTLTVRAYSPTDAQQIGRDLLQHAEALVNRLSDQGRRDLISVAEAEVEVAKTKSRAAAIRLAKYRNTHGVVDPEEQASMRMQMVSKLQDDLISTRTQFQQILTLAPRSPQLSALRSRIDELTRQIDQETASVAGNRGSLAATAVKYQSLLLESKFADKQLESALTSLEETRGDARRKQAYVERISEPSRPDYALEPHRLRGVAATLILGLVLWGVLTILLAGIKEHKD